MIALTMFPRRSCRFWGNSADSLFLRLKDEDWRLVLGRRGGWNGVADWTRVGKELG